MIHVLDASVALKWFVEESGTARALAFRDDFLAGKIVLASPDLLLYEAANVLRFKREFIEGRP
ncbi:MAG: type II toxin-antitoxin system VapC family toxin [Elusimicrobia bacterium]|nr:type II toxin-antitoxin system VapC family toxin [Elusimicrobiota bacterium]